RQRLGTRPQDLSVDRTGGVKPDRRFAVWAAPGRDLRIDLFRGLSLWFIFLDHVPGNYLNSLTPRNFGFSDAAEILVFLSGLASGIVYGNVARDFGMAMALRRILRRTARIYVAYLATIALLLAEVSLLARWLPGLMDQANVAVFFANPA